MKCALCAQENPLLARFCMGCGTAIRRHDPPSSAPAHHTPQHLIEKILSSKAALEGERKQVTVLFADLKGSMELLVDRDPEEARDILDAVVQRMMEAIHAYEGIVNQVMGDGIMALFGAPLAHEDHAIRACYAALRMQESIRQYGEEARRAYGIEVSIRVGLNSGDVVVGAIGNDLHMDYSAVGQTTHLAARMEQLARPGSVVLTAGTLRLAEGYLEVRPLGPVPVKGLSEPVDVYEVVSATAVRSRFDASLRRGLTRFIGRQPELDVLAEALDCAVAGHGQVVAVVGEPGVGKSRLCFEFFQRVHHAPLRILTAGALPYETTVPYAPLRELLKGYFDLDTRDDNATIRSRVTRHLMALDGTLRPRRSALLWLLDVPVTDPRWRRLDPVQQRRRAQDAIVALLLRETVAQPVVLLVEDLQWIDSETKAVLDTLVERLPRSRLLLLVNHRPDHEHDWSGQTANRQLAIGVLVPDDARALIDSILGGHPTLAPLKRLLLARTEGNPFFIEESVRQLVETRTLGGDRGAYRLLTDPLTVEIPATVQAVLAARIDRLSPDDKSLLLSASAIGKNVPLPLLEAIVPGRHDELPHQLTRLQSAELLFETRSYPEREYAFTHALTHDVAYGGLLREQRRALHGAIADAIERLDPDRSSEHVEQLAHHTYRAERWDSAVRHLRQAGSKAVTRSAYREAAAWYRTALAALEHLASETRSPVLAIEVRLELRGALLALGENQQILDLLQETERLATALDDAPRLAWIQGYLSLSYWGLGDQARALGAGTRARAAAERLGDERLQSLARLGVGWAHHAVGEYRRGIEELSTLAMAIGETRALTLTRGAPPMLVSALSWVAACRMELGEFAEGLGAAREAATLAEEVDHPWSRAASYYAVGMVHLRQGDLEAALPVLETGLGLCEEYEIWNWFTGLASAVGYARVLAGRPESGRDLLEQAVERAAAMQSVFRQSLRLAWLAEGAWGQSEGERARALARRALALAEAHGERGHRVHILRLLGLMDTEDDGAAAERSFTEAAAAARDLAMRPAEAQCYLGLGLLRRRHGDPSKTQDALARALALFESLGMSSWTGRARAALAEAT